MTLLFVVSCPLLTYSHGFSYVVTLCHWIFHFLGLTSQLSVNALLWLVSTSVPSIPILFFSEDPKAYFLVLFALFAFTLM